MFGVPGLIRVVLLIAAALGAGEIVLPSSAAAQVGGVFIDSRGIVRDAAAVDADERLRRLRDETFAPPSDELAAAAPLRRISLARLEETVERLHAAGEPLPAEVRYLAGLTGVRYLFLDPKSGDAVLAGPAEGWTQAPSGEVVGRRSGRPVLHLDDLVVALRSAFGPSLGGDERAAGDAPPEFIGCSIEPTPEGLQSFAAWMRRNGRRIDRSRIPQTAAAMEEAMGPQAVHLYGVPESSRFALTMVAADYRLKCLALGHDASPVPEVVPYLDLAARRFTPGAQPQHRWWFVAEYDAIHTGPDRLAFEFVGQGVRVSTAPTSQLGSAPEKAAPAAEQFATAATRHFPALAERIPVFAGLENLIALCVSAELVAQAAGVPESDSRRSAAEAGACWVPGYFLDERACRLQEFPVPRQVPSLANVRMVGGRHWLVSVSGGVEIAPSTVAGQATESAQPVPDERVALPAGRWWW